MALGEVPHRETVAVPLLQIRPGGDETFHSLVAAGNRQQCLAQRADALAVDRIDPRVCRDEGRHEIRAAQPRRLVERRVAVAVNGVDIQAPSHEDSQHVGRGRHANDAVIWEREWARWGPRGCVVP